MALAMVIVVLLAVVFGRYPVTGIPADTVKLEVRKAWDGEPVLVLTREADVREARAIAGTVWAGILGGNSLDGPGRRLLISTSKDGVEKSDWITFTEWGDGARMPEGFIDWLNRKQAEQTARLE